MGYTDAELKAILNPQSFFERFQKWMHGQTVGYCNGKEYNEVTKGYAPSSCSGHPHGIVTYRWDLERFLEGKPIID